MLFSEEDATHLKKWIVKRLENTSDADADVLADYVLALLRHDGDVSDVRKLCEAEIPDFLKEDSSVFVSDVFNALTYRSYLPGAPPAPRKPAPPAAPALAQPPTADLYYEDTPMGSGSTYQQPFRNGRKRGYMDWDDPNAQNGRDGGPGGRVFKQPRRGALNGRPSRLDETKNAGAGAPNVFPPPTAMQQPQGPPGPSTVGYYDPNGAMDAMFGMSLAAGHPMPELLSHYRGNFPPKRRKKCRDWEKKGYCGRRNCTFQHSNEPIFPLLPTLPYPQPAAMEEYDPSNALMPDFLNGPGLLPGQSLPQDLGQQRRQRGGKHQNRQRRSEKAPFSADGPVFDRTKSTIVVESIPEENFSEDHVKEFFSQFGNILEVSMQPYKRLAIVKFDSWNAANAAYQSPKVIFDNRFVKVYWYKDDGSTLPASSPLVAGAAGAAGAKKFYSTNGSPADVDDTGSHAEVDIEEFSRQQAEKQKAFEEKTKRREELERQREELEKRQKELVAKQLEEKTKLQAKLAARNGGKSGDEDGEPKASKNLSETLRAQYEALQAEARQMGLDPDAVIDAPAPWPASTGGYNNGYGRGRGGWRGASPYTPRGSSYGGGYRGRASNVHAAYAAYSLDNRPRKVVLTGVDFTVPEKDETLRQYLFGIGEFNDIQTAPAATEITFKDRKTAEKFFNSVLLNNKEVPGLEGSPVELAWGGANGSTGSVPTTPGASTPTTATTATAAGKPAAASGAAVAAGTTGADHAIRGGLAPPSTTNTATTTTNRTTTTRPANNMNINTANGGGDNDDDHHAGTDSSDKDVHILLDRPPQDLDFEVADENGWEY